MLHDFLNKDRQCVYFKEINTTGNEDLMLRGQEVHSKIGVIIPAGLGLVEELERGAAAGSERTLHTPRDGTLQGAGQTVSNENIWAALYLGTFPALRTLYQKIIRAVVRRATHASIRSHLNASPTTAFTPTISLPTQPLG